MDYLQEKFGNKKNIKIKKFNLDLKALDCSVISKPVDLIVSFETLEHLENPEKNIREFYHLLSAKGYIILSVPNEKFESVDQWGIPKSTFNKLLLSQATIEKYLQENGFHIIGKYGQSLINHLMKRENKLFKRKKINGKFSHLEAMHERENIYNSAYLFGYPDRVNIDESYSRIYVARKNKI